ncbi:transcriptional regulator, XRE family [Alkaliphilus metalliredigens QYMF]|uniref:Transcriptional regulator, XRE family n=1 Tax=Alkaliphilus metalliredigens (strain QYMF) TaxID=293826 RepID=A6TLP0_ALKMQ|nr:helix-turn-helix transcriptional regulator [Alkaliphilus metalliredigens]ABR47108.1 transcriptional regulator, XRE family [Alkaliphilus metalliredigens QYMF]
MIRIKELRQEKDFSQIQLAKQFDITQQTISNYESGVREPSITTLKNLADFFNVSIDYLLERTNIPEPVGVLGRKDDYEEGLPEEARRQIESFKEFIKQKYG